MHNVIRVKIVNGHLIQMLNWDGSYVTYIDSHATSGTWAEAVARCEKDGA